MCLDLLTRMDGKLHRLPLGIVSTFKCSWEFLIETVEGIAPVKVPTLDKHWAISVPLFSLYFGGTLIHGEMSVFEEVAVQGKNSKQRKKTWNEKLLSLYVTLPNTYFYSIISLPSCIFFFKSVFQKTLMWFFFIFFFESLFC